MPDPAFDPERHAREWSSYSRIFGHLWAPSGEAPVQDRVRARVAKEVVFIQTALGRKVPPGTRPGPRYYAELASLLEDLYDLPVDHAKLAAEASARPLADVVADLVLAHYQEPLAALRWPLRSRTCLVPAAGTAAPPEACLKHLAGMGLFLVLVSSEPLPGPVLRWAGDVLTFDPGQPGSLGERLAAYAREVPLETIAVGFDVPELADLARRIQRELPLEPIPILH